MFGFFVIAACVCAAVQCGIAKPSTSFGNNGAAHHEKIFFDAGARRGFGDASNGRESFNAGNGLKTIAQTSPDQMNTALGKQILVQKLEADVKEAHQQVQAEIQQLKQAQCAAASAQRAAQKAQQQIKAINAALIAVSQQATKELGSQQAVPPFKLNKHAKFPYKLA